MTAAVQVRQAVRVQLQEFRAADVVLVACSGGPDSLALAKALALETPAANLNAGAVVVDHGWSNESAKIANQTADLLEQIGLNPVQTKQLDPHQRTESVARELRYEVLVTAAAELGAVAVFTGHTQDDQAETLLMRLARGSGTTSLAGIPPKRDIFYRPLLSVTRSTTQAACEEWALQYWQDPANEDLSHTRVRVRKLALPALNSALGEGVTAGLARSAKLLREDSEVLDQLATHTFDLVYDAQSHTVNAEKLAQEHMAIARRVLLSWVVNQGVPKAELNYHHAHQLQGLLIDNTSARVALPGDFVAWRLQNELKCEREAR